MARASETLCDSCRGQEKKPHQAKPHEQLAAVDALRVFHGRKPRGFAEQDYQCRSCQAKFTHSTDKNDLAWTLWRG